MEYVQFWPLLAVLLLVVFLSCLIVNGGAVQRGIWRFPASLCLAFLVFSVYPLIYEGPFGFWPVHTESFWGNQVFIDLILAVGVACFFIVKKAKELEISVVPWVLLVLCSGSIGVLAFLSRVLYVQEHGRNKTKT